MLINGVVPHALKGWLTVISERGIGELTYQSSFQSSFAHATSEEPPVAEVFQEDAAAACLIVCDHASNHVPVEMAGLGLQAHEFARHIAWDIGAARVTRRLAWRLGATAVLSGISRLVIDCNRPLGHATSIPLESDQTEVPGNAALTRRQKDERAQRFFHPYHRKIEEQLARLGQSGPAVIAIHSFTPEMAGRHRPWHVGVLWNKDARLALPLMRALAADGDLLVGDNEPYSGRDSNYTLDRHGSDLGYPHVSIEIRQDLIGDDAQADGWGDRLAGILNPLLVSLR